MKALTWAIITLLLLSSVFDWKNAEVGTNQLILTGMLLLISLYAELKEFNFFGMFVGKKFSSDELRSLEGQSAITKSNDLDKKKVDRAEQQPLQLMENAMGNFLSLSFEIERLLRVYAQVMMAKDVPTNVNLNKLSKDMHSKGLLTDAGMRQLEAIRWVRNLLVHGRSSEINQATLEEALNIALSLYNELFNTLNPKQA